MRLFIIAGFACLFTLNSFAVPLSADGLRARQLAHSAANAKFLAKLEKGEAEIDVDKWQKEYNRLKEAVEKGAASSLELSVASMALTDARFRLKRGTYHFDEAVAIEESYKTEIDSIRSGVRNPKKLGQLFLDLRDSRVKIIGNLIEDGKKYAREVIGQYERGKGIPISRTEFDKLKANNDKILGLVSLAEKELEVANAQLNEAKADLE